MLEGSRNMLKKTLLLATIFTLFAVGMAKAQPGSQFGFVAGLATPNDQIANIYNSDQWDYTVSESNGIGNFITNGMNTGYTIGAKLRIKMSDNVNFFGGIGWNRFPQTTLELRDPQRNDTLLATFKTTTNIVPISAGVDYYIANDVLGLFSIYGVGELAYNYISNSVDYKTESGVDVPITLNPSDSRMGFGVGAGFDINLKLVTLNLEAKYNYLNLIGKTNDEGNKDYLTVTAGIFF